MLYLDLHYSQVLIHACFLLTHLRISLYGFMSTLIFFLYLNVHLSIFIQCFFISRLYSLEYFLALETAVNTQSGP